MSLADLTTSADRAQASLDRLLSELERGEHFTLEFRLIALGEAVGILYKLAGVRKTLVALRDNPRPNLNRLRDLNERLVTIHDEFQRLETTYRKPYTPDSTPTPANLIRKPRPLPQTPEPESLNDPAQFHPSIPEPPSSIINAQLISNSASIGDLE